MQPWVLLVRDAVWTTLAPKARRNLDPPVAEPLMEGLGQGPAPRADRQAPEGPPEHLRLQLHAHASDDINAQPEQVLNFVNIVDLLRMLAGLRNDLGMFVQFSSKGADAREEGVEGPGPGGAPGPAPAFSASRGQGPGEGLTDGPI